MEDVGGAAAQTENRRICCAMGVYGLKSGVFCTNCMYARVKKTKKKEGRRCDFTIFISDITQTTFTVYAVPRFLSSVLRSCKSHLSHTS
jgi:hypothetical protein